MESQIIIILISILFSSFFSGMEIAYVSTNKIFVEIEKKQKGINSYFIKKITNNPSKFIATMLLGNTLSLVVYSIYTGRLIIELFFPNLLGLENLNLEYIFYQTLISTFLILIASEFLPKVLFQMYANKLFKFFSFPTYFFYILLTPITSFLNWISNSVLSKYFKTKKDEMKMFFSKDELGDYIDQEIGDNNDHSIDTEIKIFKNALKFSNVRAREIMIHRNDIVSVDRYIKTNELKEIFIKTGLSKILIHKENIDNIIGYISIQRFFSNHKNFKSILMPIEFVPESMFINDLLNLLTKKKKGIAVVVDEYGGCAGLITIEDIVEELIGEIEDEHDPQNFDKKIVLSNP